MKHNRDISLSNWLVAAMLVATIQVAIAPRSAQARCGDYVVHAAPSQTHSVPIHPDLSPSGPLHSGHCTGPYCSNDDSRPLNVPATPGETEVRQWGLIAVQWLEAIVAPQFARFADDAALPRVVASPVYRPPR